MNQARLFAPDSAEAHTTSGRTAPARDDAASHTILPVASDSIRSRLVAPVLLLFTLGTLDVPLTLSGLAQGGIELNPIARRVIDHAGLDALMPFRLALLATATLALTRLAPAAPRAARICILSACAIFGAVDLLSLSQLVIS